MKQTVSFGKVGLPGTYLYPCAEEFRSVYGTLWTAVIQNRGIQGQFSSPIVHVVKVEANTPESFLSGQIRG